MIEVTVDGDLHRVTLSRAEKANSLTREMLQDLVGAAQDARKAKAFILTGRGKVFSAGMDLNEAQSGLATDPVWEQLSTAIADIEGLSIAALNGTLAGGAFGMALACDLRIAVPQANFFYPVMKLGFLPQPSDPGRLRELVGPARAKLILMGGAKIAAEEALRIGLIDRVVAAENIETECAALCKDSLSAESGHITGIKGLIR